MHNLRYCCSLEYVAAVYGKKLRAFDDWSSILLLVLVALLGMLNFRLGSIVNGSMDPTLGVGEVVLYKTIADTDSLRHGCIIVYAIIHRNFQEDPALLRFLDRVSEENQNPYYMQFNG